MLTGQSSAERVNEYVSLSFAPLLFNWLTEMVWIPIKAKLVVRNVKD